MAQSNRLELGYPQDLFILPFDHRGTFEKKLLGIEGRALSPEERARIADFKRIVFEGFKRALQLGVPRGKAGILVDEEYGSEILKEAKAEGILTSVSAEKSSQEEFQFQYGEEFAAHLEAVDTPFVKALIRYNPERDVAMNRRQTERLKRLDDACKGQGRKLMLELVVPAAGDQLCRVDQDLARFDAELRPALTLLSLQELQAAGINPDVWKLEGLETPEDTWKVAAQVRVGGRERVGIILLGRGEDESRVRHWIRIAAKVPGMIGFAIGRTIFWDALTGFHLGRIPREDAIERIAVNYRSYCELWVDSRREIPLPRAEIHP